MPTNTDRCLRCEGEMEEGFTVARGIGAPAQWVRGKKKYGVFYTLKLGGQPKYQTIAKRCTECGWLDFYATKRAY